MQEASSLGFLRTGSFIFPTDPYLILKWYIWWTHSLPNKHNIYIVKKLSYSIAFQGFSQLGSNHQSGAVQRWNGSSAPHVIIVICVHGTYIRWWLRKWRKKIRFVAVVALIKCLKQIKWQRLLLTCAPISEFVCVLMCVCVYVTLIMIN